jgi:hypothetical protein
MRWVRPDFTTVFHSVDLSSRARRRWSRAGRRSLTADSVAATCVAVGKVSLDDSDMLTTSLGWTTTPFAAAIDAITSLAFMLELVPEPVWKTSMGN